MTRDDTTPRTNPTRTWLRLEESYLAQHTHPTNRRLHALGVPTIVFSILLALEAVPRIDAGLWVTALFCASYLVAARGAAIPVVVCLMGGHGVARYVVSSAGGANPWALIAGLFLAGWALQLCGHRIEGNRPAFLTNLVHLWVAPLALLPRIRRRA